MALKRDFVHSSTVISSFLNSMIPIKSGNSDKLGPNTKFVFFIERNIFQ